MRVKAKRPALIRANRSTGVWHPWPGKNSAGELWAALGLRGRERHVTPHGARQ